MNTPVNTPGFSDAALTSLTDQELLEQLTDTDLQIEQLQREVRRRMQLRASCEHRREQHAEISRMLEDLDQVKIDWQKVREFFRESIVEIQEPRNG